MRHNVPVPEPADRPDVEVPGEVRMQWRADDDTWWAQVSWRPPGTNSRRLDSFPTERMRLA